MMEQHQKIMSVQVSAKCQKKQVKNERRDTGGSNLDSFPVKLHKLLENVDREKSSSVISWLPHGRAFKVHDPKAFTSNIVPKYFNQTKFTSFQRQLNLYNFSRCTRGQDSGAYYHELFLRNEALLCHEMVRQKIKGTGRKLGIYSKKRLRKMSPINDDTWPIDDSKMHTKSVASSSKIPKKYLSEICASTTSGNHLGFKKTTEHGNYKHFTCHVTCQHKIEENDVVMFEGMTFHYLESDDFQDFFI